MQAAEFRFRQAQHDIAVINNRAFENAEISLIGISTESDLVRANCRQFVQSVYHRHIGVALIFKNAQLGGAIIGDGAITIEMVWSEIEPQADRRTKRANPFELE